MNTNHKLLIHLRALVYAIAVTLAMVTLTGYFQMVHANDKVAARMAHLDTVSRFARLECRLNMIQESVDNK